VRTRYGRQLRLLAALFAMSLVAAACGGGGGGGGGGTATGKKGGAIVLAAEQYPECLNPITSCANASWLPWTGYQYVVPRLTEVDPKGNFVGTDLAPELPTKENGGLKENPFTVTYKLNPQAVWDDGSPITSEDVKFTWQAILKTTGTLTTTGYDQIDSIDTSDPKTVVIKFKAPYADWWDLFGGNFFWVLKKSAFGGKVDLKDAMKDNYPFSGGPWKMKSWSKQQAVFVPNDKYWVKDKIPRLDQVTFVPREDQSTELNALLTGEAQGIFPQPSRGMTKRLKAPGVSYKGDVGNTYEGLWFNESKFPFNDKAVREAMGYAVDRQGIIDAIFKADFPDLKILNCAGWVPTVGNWCDDTQFANFTYDTNKAKQILQAGGWTMGSDGIMAKGGKKLSIEFITTAGNKNRNDTQALLKEKVKPAGIDLVLKTAPPTQLFEDKLPKLDYEMAEFAQVASPDPSVTGIYACDFIPTKANGYSGQNQIAWCNKEATRLAKESDKVIDIPKREQLIKQVGALVRQDIAWLPLYQKPLILAWRSDKLTGPIGDYTASSNSGFFNMNLWSLK
jgi:peptide/nickel transport system substrate-binding protein